MEDSSRTKFHIVAEISPTRDVMCRAVRRGNSEETEQDLRQVHAATGFTSLGNRCKSGSGRLPCFACG